MKVSKDTSERLLMIQSLYIFCTLLVGEVLSGSILSIFLVSIVKIIYYTETNKEQTISIRKAMRNYKKTIQENSYCSKTDLLLLPLQYGVNERSQCKDTKQVL